MDQDPAPTTSSSGPGGAGSHVVEVLDASRCWALVRESPVGRLGVIVEGRPEIFPVNHVVDHGSILFRSASGTKVDASLGHPVAFEVDGYDAAHGAAWSVVVSGRAREVTGTDDVIDAMRAPLFPWHQGSKPRFVRIETEWVTGRRFSVTGGARSADA